MVRGFAWLATPALVQIACVAPPPSDPPPPASAPVAGHADVVKGEPVAPEPPRQPDFHDPALTKPALEARRRAQIRLLGKVVFGDGYPEGERPAGNPAGGSPPVGDERTLVDALALGRFVSLQGGGDAALTGFHGALRGLKSDSPAGGKVRVLFYGSSQTAADYMTTYLRGYLQYRFGDGGHGYVALAAPWKGYRHLDVTVKTTGEWHTDHAQRDDRREDGTYGLLGASVSTTSPRHRTVVTSRAAAAGTRYDLQYLLQPAGGRFLLDLDGKSLTTVDTKAKVPAPGYHGLDLELASHEIRIRPQGDGEIRLFGVVIENNETGVVVDTLGINGARAANHLLWNETFWADVLGRRDPDLYVLAYGANEAGDDDDDVTIETYERELGEVLDRFQRAAPNASCLLVGPGDFPEPQDDETYRPRARLQAIVEIQRALALAGDCAFWDTQAFMGGPMGMVRWVRAKPIMARPDHLHLTRRGYARMAMALTDAMMYGYDAGT